MYLRYTHPDNQYQLRHKLAIIGRLQRVKRVATTHPKNSPTCINVHLHKNVSIDIAHIQIQTILERG